jgi:hypothetical protein
MLLGRPVSDVGRQGDLFVSHQSKRVSRFTGFGKVPVGDKDRIVVPQRPETVVEQPVGILGEGDAVGGVVVATAGKLVDMAGVDDGAELRVISR